jgi:hypothetical protein
MIARVRQLLELHAKVPDNIVPHLSGRGGHTGWPRGSTLTDGNLTGEFRKLLGLFVVYFVQICLKI